MIPSRLASCALLCSAACGVALCASSARIYWTDRSAGTIQRVDPNGGNLETLVTGLEEPRGIALDPAGGQMYWTVHDTGKIQRATLDGENVASG